MNDIDEQFIDSIREKTNDYADCDNNDAFSFWLLIMILMFFIFTAAVVCVWVVRKKRLVTARKEIAYRVV